MITLGKVVFFKVWQLLNCYWARQGIMERGLGKFFYMLSFYNGIAVDVQYVILQPGRAGGRNAWKQIDGKKRKQIEYSEAFPKVEHKHGNPVKSFNYARINKSIIYVATQWTKSNHQQVVSQQSTQNTANSALATSEKNQWFF